MDITEHGGIDETTAPALTLEKAAPRRRLSAADIERAAAKAPPPTEDVPIEEWDGFVTMQGLTATERDAFEASLRRQGKKGRILVRTENMRAKLVVKCAVDEKGNRLWQTDDVAWVGKLPAGIINKLYEVASRLSGMNDDDTEELEGNS